MSLIGVLITVPEPHGARLDQARASYGVPDGATVPSHITLVPPADVPEVEVPALCSRLAAAAHATAAYPLALRGTGTFRPVSDVVFVAVSQGISFTELLARRIRDGIGDAVPDAEFPYHPHVTVAQGVSADALDRAYDDLADFECAFTVESFSLYRHGPDGWERTDTFVLEG